MAVKQYSALGRITDSMILVLAFQGIYVADAMYNEAGILTQMDITTDGFGFMLAVGDLTWVTFTYGLQTRYLALYPRDLGVLQTCAILATNGLGYYIFRVSNDEKNSFRLGRNPKSQSRLFLFLSCWVVLIWTCNRSDIHEDGKRNQSTHKRMVGTQSASELCTFPFPYHHDLKLTWESS